jgi:hypothetical protein
LDRADPGGYIDMLGIIYDEKMKEYGAKLYFITTALMPFFHATRRPLVSQEKKTSLGLNAVGSRRIVLKSRIKNMIESRVICDCFLV